MQYISKVILLGDIKSGKTSIMQMFVDSTFDEAQLTTIGIDVRLRKVALEFQQMMKIYICDVGGNDKYQMIVHEYVKNYVKHGHVAMIVYDVTNPDGLASVQRWLDFAREFQSDNLRTIIVANKIDHINKRVITPYQGLEFSQQLGLPYYEISAQNKRSVDFLFESALRISIKHNLENQQLQEIIRKQYQSIKIYTAFLVILLILVIFVVIFIL